MLGKPSILSITGSDPKGGAGVQADIKTITAMGADAYAVVTAVTAQDAEGISSIYDLPEHMVMGQVRAAIKEMRAQSAVNETVQKAVKVGMVRNADTIVSLSKEIVAMRNIVSAPGIVSSGGSRLLPDEAVMMWERYVLPMTKVLVVRCDEVEVLLKMRISTNEDMERAAQMLAGKGAESVLIRGGNHVEGMLTALLYDKGRARFFTSHNMEGWKRHGIGGAMSTAIAVRLAMGDDVVKAVDKAHEYMHSQVVYAMTPSHTLVAETAYRPADLYNQFLSLVADNYRAAHDVAFYADRMAITARYLYNVTDRMVGKSPKTVLAEYILHEAKKLLETSRLSVQEISDELGFSSQVIFCRFFNNYAGCTPSSYRLKN